MATKIDQPGGASPTPTNNIVSLAERRAVKDTLAGVPLASLPPAWANKISVCCAYARMLRAQHDAEAACIQFEQRRDGITEYWWEGPEHFKDRIDANNWKWERFIELCRHVASLRATTRQEATDKRHTIGRMWLSADSCLSEMTGPMRDGCIRDDHLFPPSMRLEKSKNGARRQA